MTLLLFDEKRSEFKGNPAMLKAIKTLLFKHLYGLHRSNKFKRQRYF